MATKKQPKVVVVPKAPPSVQIFSGQLRAALASVKVLLTEPDALVRLMSTGSLLTVRTWTKEEIAEVTVPLYAEKAKGFLAYVKHATLASALKGGGAEKVFTLEDREKDVVLQCPGRPTLRLTQHPVPVPAFQTPGFFPQSTKGFSTTSYALEWPFAYCDVAVEEGKPDFTANNALIWDEDELVGTDGVRIHMSRVPKGMPTGLMPAGIARAYVKAIDVFEVPKEAPAKMEATKGFYRVSFEHGGMRYEGVAKQREAKAPDYRTFIPDAKRLFEVQVPGPKFNEVLEGAMEALKKAKLPGSCVLEFNKSVARVYVHANAGKGAPVLWSDGMACSTVPGRFAVGINPSRLSDTLDFPEDLATLYFAKEEQTVSPFLVRQGGALVRTALVMPVKTEAALNLIREAPVKPKALKAKPVAEPRGVVESINIAELDDVKAKKVMQGMLDLGVPVVEIVKAGISLQAAAQRRVRLTRRHR